MGFLSDAGSRNLWIERLAVDTGNWFHVFSACLGKMMAVQTACSDQVVKGQDWNIDFEEGSIRFNLLEASPRKATHGYGAGRISTAFPKKFSGLPITQKKSANAGD